VLANVEPVAPITPAACSFLIAKALEAATPTLVGALVQEAGVKLVLNAVAATLKFETGTAAERDARTAISQTPARGFAMVDVWEGEPVGPKNPDPHGVAALGFEDNGIPRGSMQVYATRPPFVLVTLNWTELVPLGTLKNSLGSFVSNRFAVAVTVCV
jgi:hypothetical protein